jgi:farnesyl-diphosphate farnesyltransferase
METQALSLRAEMLAEQSLQEVSRSFAFTIPQLPSELRRIVTNAYLICRIVDTIEDEEALSIDEKRSFFDEFHSVLNRSLLPQEFADHVYPLLSKSASRAEKELILNTPMVVQSFFRFSPRQQHIIKRCAAVMSSGMLRFHHARGLNGLVSLQDMIQYCYFVAGCVGEMLTELFCEYSPEIEKKRERLFTLAASFGQGLQMTNILKDVWEDRRHGLCWLPRDIFEKAGYNLFKLELEGYRPEFGKGLTQLINITRFYLKKGLNYTLEIPSHETGIRKFCLWSIGMAIFTLRNISRKLDYQNAEEIKISRKNTKAVIAVSNAIVRHNLMLQMAFNLSSWSCGMRSQ